LLSNSNRQLSLSAGWPETVKQATASGLESAQLGRSVLYVKVARSESEQDIRARVNVFVAEVDKQNETETEERVFLGGFSLFPAASAEALQTMDAPTFAFNLEPYLNSLSVEERQGTMLSDLQLILELVPFESEADLAQGQIEIIEAEIKWKVDQ